MAENAKRVAPPYASFSAYLNFNNKLRDTAIPSRIDPSVFGNASGSVSYSIIAALKSLKLINAEGAPTAQFTAFVIASDEDRKPLMQTILKEGYPTLWGGAINVATVSSGQFDEHIRSEYEAKGSTVDKVASFFIAAATFADIELSPHLKARKATKPSASSSKSKRQRKVSEDAVETAGKPPILASPTITDMALEYKLVDLMREDGIETDERAAIWTLLQYLTAKAKKAAPEKKTAVDPFS